MTRVSLQGDAPQWHCRTRVQILAWRRGASGWEVWHPHRCLGVATFFEGWRQLAVASASGHLPRSSYFISMLRYASLPKFDALWMCEWRCRMQTRARKRKGWEQPSQPSRGAAVTTSARAAVCDWISGVHVYACLLASLSYTRCILLEHAVLCSS